jgi:hypothetical protein
LSERLPAKIEVTAIMRRAESQGGNASVLHRGDPDRGAVSLLVAERGVPVALLERQMAADFTSRWMASNADELPGAGWRDWLEKKSRIDPDCWLIELDIADAQRFIAETTASG